MATTKWTEDQSQAIAKRGANILVSASAGSGKTAVLVERVIQKVVNEYLDVDKIMVVTFTNAAAQELKEKILNAIYKALDTETDPQKINHLKNQLIYINRANITTIDAFCYRLVKENFSVLEIDPNIRICEESQSVLIKAKVLEELLEKEYESYSETDESFGLYNILELFRGKDEALLESILKIYNYIQAFPKPFKWLDEQIEKYNIDENVDLYQTDFGKDIYEDVLSELQLYIYKYDDIFNKIQGNEDFNKTFDILDAEYCRMKDCVNIETPSWDELFGKLNLIQFQTFSASKGANPELKEEIKGLRAEAKKVKERSLKKVYAVSKEILEDNRIGYTYMKYLYNFLVAFDKVFKEEKKAQGVAEFNDIMHYALDLLVDDEDNNTSIAIALKDRFKEVYTDEYQDTSAVQERILEAVSKEDNRFMVGDIKQSIYGFRQARPDIFNQKYTEYMKNSDASEEDKQVKIILSKNFRSRIEVIDSINYIFERIMSMANGDCDYSLDETLKCGNESYPQDENVSFKTEINIIDLKDNPILPMEGEEEKEKIEIEEDTGKFEIEAKCIAVKIEDIIQNAKVTAKDGTLRKATYKDIVILLRSMKGKSQILEEALKQRNIPVFSDQTSSIFEGDEVKLVLSFLRILDNPYQDIYMVSIMYSIIGNFTLDEITKIRLYNSKAYVIDTLDMIAHDEEFRAQEKELVEKIDRFLELIKNYTIYSKIYSISDLLIRIFKDTNIYYQLALEENAASKKANLDYLIELATNFNVQIGNTLNSYIRYVDNLRDKDDSTSSAKIIGENENVVRIMSIHKSKGLEFPIVIIADTAKMYNFQDVRNSKILFHHSYGIGIDIVNQSLGVTYPSLIKQAVKGVMEREIKSEEIRLLYVALTRAKEKLYIFSTVKDYEKDIDSQILRLEESGKFNESLVRNATSYYKLILPVCKYYSQYEGEEKVLDICHRRIKDASDERIKEAFGVKDREEKKYSISEILENFRKEKDAQANEETIEKVRKNIEEEYPYLEDTKTPSRVSVSNLKKARIEEEEEKTLVAQNIKDETNEFVEDENGEEIVDTENDETGKIVKTQKEFKLPDSISKESGYTAVRKGILIHFILQNLDFTHANSKKEIKEYILKLVDENTISRKDQMYISVNRIFNFMNSKIGQELKTATKTYREYEFVLDNKEISRSLIQGVIDLMYITEDNRCILVDFKTDKLTQEEDFIKRYKIQLDIYKEAINTLTDYTVDETYIYSFNMNKEIKVED